MTDGLVDPVREELPVDEADCDAVALPLLDVEVVRLSL